PPRMKTGLDVWIKRDPAQTRVARLGPAPPSSVTRVLLVFGRNRVLVLRQPHLEALQRGVQAPAEFRAACPGKIVLEVALELKHVAQIIRAGETEPAVHLGRHAVVTDFLPEHFAEN